MNNELDYLYNANSTDCLSSNLLDIKAFDQATQRSVSKPHSPAQSDTLIMILITPMTKKKRSKTEIISRNTSTIYVKVLWIEKKATASSNCILTLILFIQN